MNLNYLARRVAKGADPRLGGSMNVEDMIRFVLAHGPQAADEIERLNELHGWLRENKMPDGSLVPPFACWADVCIAFGRGGVRAAEPLLRDPRLATFAVSVLQDVRSLEAVHALVDLAKDLKWESPDPQAVSWKTMAALNVLLAFDDRVEIPESTLLELQNVVCRAYDAAPTPFLRLLCLCLSRGIPTAPMLSWAETLKCDDAEVNRVRKQAIRVLRQRLQSGWRPLTALEKREVRRQRAADV